MARRQRTRARTRRGTEAARHTPAPIRSERDDTPATRSAAHRPSRGSRTGYSRAAGAPSAALERSAVMERAFVVKDFRRVGIVVAISLVVLILAGFIEGMIVR